MFERNRYIGEQPIVHMNNIEAASCLPNVVCDMQKRRRSVAYARHDISSPFIEWHTNHVQVWRNGLLLSRSCRPRCQNS